jgi:hypothetical protein
MSTYICFIKLKHLKFKNGWEYQITVTSFRSDCNRKLGGSSTQIQELCERIFVMFSNKHASTRQDELMRALQILPEGVPFQSQNPQHTRTGSAKIIKFEFNIFWGSLNLHAVASTKLAENFPTLRDDIYIILHTNKRRN